VTHDVKRRQLGSRLIEF